MAAANHYELLQIAPEASPQELRQAFRRLSKHYHPDTTALPEAQAREGFRRLQAAYLTLSDPERRRAYDASLAVVLPPPSVTRTVVVPAPARRALSINSMTAWRFSASSEAVGSSSSRMG